MIDKMTLDEFEALLDDFGSDISLWPKSSQAAARRFAVTSNGQFLLAADQALDGLFVSARAVGPETANDSNCDVFIEKLKDIPVYHQQIISDVPIRSAKKSFGIIGRLKSMVENSFYEITPTALVSQFAMFVIVLSVGVMVGLNSPQDTSDYDEIDIIETLFVADLVYELDEQ